MGISLNIDAFNDEESRKRAAIQKRYRTLAVVLILTVGARLVFKNPPPPKRADHREFRALPGVLNNLSEASRQKFTPTQLAMLREADHKVVSGIRDNESESLAQKTNNSPLETSNYKFVYKTREAERWVPTTEIALSDKTKVVVFVQGGHILAQDVEQANQTVDIKINKSIQAKIPIKNVRAIIADGSTWEEPIPKGQVRLKPAKGITVMLASNTAKRITITKSILKKDEKAS